MSITFTYNYKETLAPSTVMIVDEMVENGYELEEVLDFVDYFGEEYSEVIESIIDAVNDAGSGKSDLYDFIEDQGVENVEYFPTYYSLIEDHNPEAVAAFMSLFDVSDLHLFEETYEGYFDSKDNFVDYIIESYDANIPTWIVIDAESTWETALRFDYDEENGYYFRHL